MLSENASYALAMLVSAHIAALVQYSALEGLPALVPFHQVFSYTHASAEWTMQVYWLFRLATERKPKVSDRVRTEDDKTK